jgi:hypothetical protein
MKGLALVLLSGVCAVPDRAPLGDPPPPKTIRIQLKPGLFEVQRFTSKGELWLMVVQNGDTVVDARALYLGDDKGQCMLEPTKDGVKMDLITLGFLEFLVGSNYSVPSVPLPPGSVVVTSPSITFNWIRR